MPKLTLGPAFFRKELHSAYSFWGMAFWREMIQNSVDAAATLIDIAITPVEGTNNVLVRFTDDGCGMTRDILDNVFFKLGESTKASGGTSTGGFGRARIMTHFAQERYEIVTRDLHVKGVGEEFDYYPPEHYRGGTQMVIEVHPFTSWGSKIDMKAELVKYLSSCQLPCRVDIDGERHTDWTYRRASLKPLSLNGEAFGTIHVNKSAIEKDAVEGKLLVRVNGTTMFTRDIKPKLQVILEIDPAKSRSVLQSSRDNLNYDYNRTLNAFVDELNTETKSALRKEEKESKTISGTGTFVAYQKDATAYLSNRGKKIAAEHSIFPDKIEFVPAAKPIDGEDRLVEFKGLTDGAGTGKVIDNGENLIIDEAARNNLFDIMIFRDMGEFSDAEKKAVGSVVSAYDPRNWKIGYRKSQATEKNPTGLYFEGLQRAKLLLIWKAMCSFAVIEAINLFDMDRVQWGVGWNFDSDDAKHMEQEDVHYLMLNPVGRDGKMKYELRDQDDLDMLWAYAIHEAVHIKYSRHDEDYANAVTRLMGRCLKHLPALRKALRDVYRVKMV